MRDIDRLLEDGGVDIRMRCPSCFAYGKEGRPVESRYGAKWTGPIKPDPECAYCHGAGFVEVIVSHNMIDVEGIVGVEMPMFDVAR